MELNKYDPIKNLNTTRFDWKCRLRLQSCWKGINRQTKEFFGMNMLFIDDCNWRIHAFASTKFCKSLFSTIKENKIYVLTNFKVKDFLGDETYRPSRNNKHLYFTTHTKLEEDFTVGMKIDEYAFDLFHFADLDKLADDNRYLIDVVGKIQNLRTSLKSVKNEVEKNLTKFELSNGSSAVSVTLFDDFGKDFEDELNDFQQEDVYVIICAARVGRYEGLTNLTNYPATRIYINPRHYSIKELKNKIKTMEAEDAVSSPEEDEHIANMTVKDIKSLPEKFDKAKVRCKIEVTSVVEDSGWCYAKCTKCPKEIARENGVYKCGNCQRIIPYPDKRFRLCTLCSDCTGSVAIIFPDEEISRIIDKTVFDIEANAIKEKTQDKFPTILKQFENKKYTITLAINKTNLEEGSNVYDACEILDKIEAGGNHDPSRESNVSMDYQSTVNIKSDNEDTPHTGVSSNKTKTLQEVGPIAYDDQTAVPNKRARMNLIVTSTSPFDNENVDAFGSLGKNY